jgi:hypothetical protein
MLKNNRRIKFITKLILFFIRCLRDLISCQE